ncbi:Carboxylesterase NlhH [Planctomycetales bacterium 10988]|nr:Carboxylesterase NlhH [Planctomycetales bacterium 10988]
MHLGSPRFGRCKTSWLLAVCGLMVAFSSATAEEVTSKQILYSPDVDPPLYLHVDFPPGWQASDNRPVIVFYFGGGWRGGSVKQFKDQAHYLASRGLVAIRVDYRIQSLHKVTPNECVKDAFKSMDYIVAHQDELGIDPNKIIAAGGSAGGHLAACTALTPRAKLLQYESKEEMQPAPRPIAMVLFNPVVSFASIDRLEERLPEKNRKRLVNLISPVLHMEENCPPTIMFFGTKDELIAQGEEFLEKSESLGVRAELVTAEGEKHSFFNRDPWKSRTLYDADVFLQSLGLLDGPATMEKP